MVCDFLCVRRDIAPSSLEDIIHSLQKKHGLKIPKCDEEWADMPRTSVCTRRSDGLKEALKSARFDPAKLFKVHNCITTLTI